MLVHCVMEKRINMKFCFKFDKMASCRVFVVCGYNSLLRNHVSGTWCTIIHGLILLRVGNDSSSSIIWLSCLILYAPLIFRHQTFYSLQDWNGQIKKTDLQTFQICKLLLPGILMQEQRRTVLEASNTCVNVVRNALHLAGSTSKDNKVLICKYSY